MSAYLYRLGRFTYTQRRFVALVWLVIVGAVVAGAATLSGSSSDSFTVPGTESQEALDVLEERFPEAAADGATARVVFVAPDGETLGESANREIVEEVVATIQASPQVAQLASPFETEMISPDGTVALARVTYAVGFLELDDVTRELLFDAAKGGRDQGLTVELGGDAIEAEPELGSELVGLVVAAAVLIVTFGSLVAAGMPLVVGVTGVLIGVAGITAATGFMDIGSTTPILATMLGLAVGIDYSLFIVSRYRHELIIGRDGAEAAGRAIGTAGSAVVFAGLTVIIALGALAVVDIPLLTEMGFAAALTVGLAVLVALTMLPALLGFAGRRVLSVRMPGLKVRDAEGDEPTFGRRWAQFIGRRPIAVLAVAVVTLGIIALPVADLRLGLPDEGTYPAGSTQRQAYDHIADGFGPGFNGPLLVVADGRDAAETAASVLSDMDGVLTASEPVFNEGGDTAIINVVPESAPDSAQTEDLVEVIRAELPSALVTGTTAVFIDFNEKMREALVPYLAVVVGLSFVLLMIVFRSIVVPLKAALGFLLSIAATFGALVAIFQWGWLTDLLGIEQTGLVISILPILIIGVVFGLAMDYEVFLVTRMREEFVYGADPQDAVVTGYQHGARVVAAAALIMFSVFGGFALGDAGDVIQMGVALAIAIVFDALIVRMTIVPAVLALVGEHAWRLPRWLDRLLPNVDVEGERLARYLAERPAAREPAVVE
jgi:RND superfamily putative drug exporter